MATITTRSGKGSPLTNNEVDANFTNLNTDKAELSGATFTGQIVAPSLDISGDLDVDGTTNLDVVDIDGAVDMASTLAVGGVVTANAGVAVDNITIDGNEIDVGSGDLTLDVAGDIILDADGGDIFFKDGGVTKGTIQNSSDDLVIKVNTQDKDLLFKGNDGGSGITALTLDMSNGGSATFNKDILIGDGNPIRLGDSQDLRIFYSGGSIFQDTTSDSDMFFKGNDGGSTITALTLDMSAAGAATFNGAVTVGGNFAVQGADVDVTANIRHAGDTDTYYGFHGENLYRVVTGGTERLEVSNSGIIINDSGADADFRVESNNNANMLFVDGGNDAVGIGTGSIDYTTSGRTVVHIEGSAGALLALEDTGAKSYLFQSGNDLLIENDTASGKLVFGTNSSTSRFEIAADGSLSTPTAGTSNVRFGVNAGNSITSGGNYNTVVGDEAGTAITTGFQNVAVGYQALDAEDTGGRSVAIGMQALSAQNNDASNYNTAVGYAAGQAVTTGVQNTLIGGLAGDAITDANNNVAVGYASLSTNQRGAFNTAVGVGALQVHNPSGAANTYNTAVGFDAGNAVTTGVQNTLIGGLAGDALTTANNNVAIGVSAAGATTTGGSNVAIAVNALGSNTTGSTNVAIGQDTLFSNTTASNNTAVGHNAMVANTTGANNTAVGKAALTANTTGTRNDAFGYQAGTALTTGAYNTFIGERAGTSQTTASENTAVGSASLSANTTGTGLVAMGKNALAANTGSNNTAVGSRSLEANTTASNNTAVGKAALNTNTTGASNVGIGFQALYTNNASDNTAVGHNALFNNTSGTSNTAFGKSAGENVTTGYNNTLLGALAGDGTVTTGGGNIIIGYGSELGGAGQENQIVLATNSVGKGSATAFINANGGNTFQGNNSASWATVSDERLKKNITNNTDGLSIINSVVVRNFEYKTPDEVESAGELAKSNAVEVTGTQLGVIAQELAEVSADCVVEHDTGVKSVQSDKLNWHMINAIKELSAQVDALTARIETLEG